MKQLVRLIPFLALLAACGGGNQQGKNASPLDGMRNDCHMGLGRYFGANGYPFEQHNGSAVSYYKRKLDGTYGWYPLALFSSTSAFDFGFSKETSGQGKDGRCDQIADVFLGKGGTRSELAMDFSYSGFPYPATAGGVGKEEATIDAAPATDLIVRYYKGNTLVKTQKFPAIVRCGKAFTARRSWETATTAGQDSEEDKFCRLENGNKVCLQFTADFGDECEYRIQDGQFEAIDGGRFKASVGGKFTKAKEKGYDFSVTSYELD